MKKYLILLLAAAMSFGTVSAQSAKEIKKNSKKVAKQKQKEGWEAVNNTLTLDLLYNKDNTTLLEDEENRIAIIGNAMGTNNVKVGKMNAVNAGITEYTTRVAANVTGKLKTIVSSDATSGVDVQEIDKFGAAFESKVKQKLNGLVKTTFTIRKKDANNYRYEVYMWIDRTAAAREAAIIAKETMDAYKMQSLSDQVEDFIGDALSDTE